ncbi:MAG TPA: hypothetical protein VFS65_01470 [Candidatus Saccharimonadales bacterium]|nr:hypothetical protein [Candidatus Saccharimonadales bacterium]
MQSSTGIKDATRYDALSSVVTPDDLVRYKKAGAKNVGTGWIALIVILGFLASIFFIMLAVNFFIMFFDGGRFSLGESDIEELSTLAIVTLVLALPIIPLLFLNGRGNKKALADEIRFRRFAEDNGWVYEKSPALIKGKGSIFNNGTERTTSGLLRSQSSPEFMLGQQRYVTGVGRGRSSFNWTFVTIETNANLPHIVLDAKTNNGKIFGAQLFSNLPEVYGKEKKVSVNPELDALYDVYGTGETVGSDIATIFTPSIVSRLRTLKGVYDFEVVDGVVYAYSDKFKADFTYSQEEVAEYLTLVDILSDAFSVPVNHLTRTQADQPSSATLEGHTPRYLTVLGVAAIIIQLAALIGLIVL